MSVAVYNHYKRLMQQQQLDDEVEIEKKTSSWWDKRNRKTLVAKTIAKMLTFQH
jgi:ATP-dependent Clp protease ATP-binding subunit ClpX